MSMATAVPPEQVIASAELRFGKENIDRDRITEKCAAAFQIPEFERWCPPALLDISNLENYYKQLTLAQCLEKMPKGWSFPNAIYLNALDYGGKIRTGSEVLWGKERSTANDSALQHSTTGYAYVDTIIAANIYQACNPVSHHEISDECAQMTETLQQRIAMNPVST